jgi:hypothetical protein
MVVARGISRIIFKNPRISLEICDCGLILNKNRSLFAKWHGFLDFGFIFQRKIWWTGSTTCGPGGAVWVHGGPRWRGQEGTTVPCWHMGARAHRCSPMVER